MSISQTQSRGFTQTAIVIGDKMSVRVSRFPKNQHCSTTLVRNPLRVTADVPLFPGIKRTVFEILFEIEEGASFESDAIVIHPSVIPAEFQRMLVGKLIHVKRVTEMKEQGKKTRVLVEGVV